ncbi:hypothetical protein KP509_1Z024200 [Ceratopteris richardii]|nr:hypothetical protein KP509_1Z024200 [Ceratopteris richardii]
MVWLVVLDTGRCICLFRLHTNGYRPKEALHQTSLIKERQNHRCNKRKVRKDCMTRTRRIYSRFLSQRFCSFSFAFLSSYIRMHEEQVWCSIGAPHDNEQSMYSEHGSMTAAIVRWYSFGLLRMPWMICTAGSHLSISFRFFATLHKETVLYQLELFVCHKGDAT